MESRKLQRALQRVAVIALISFASFAIFAQDDPDPNSPTPIFISADNSTQALAIPAKSIGTIGKIDLKKIKVRSFAPNSIVIVFVANLNLLDGEDAGAFRMYAEESSGHKLRFPVLNIQPVPSYPGIYGVTIQLKDSAGFWGQLAADGNVNMSLAWRGMVSNTVQFPIGSLEKRMMPPTGSHPTPLDQIGKLVKGSTAGMPSSPNYVGYRYSGDRLRFLEQATFGPTPSLDERVRRIGLRTWLAEQFSAPFPSQANPYPAQPLKPSSAPSDCDNNQTVPDVPVTCYRDTYSMYQPQTWFMREAFYGDAQLRNRVAWALAQLWVTSGVDIQQGRQMVEYYKILSNNAFGNYRDLMQQMTLNPTMGSYLNMVDSTKNNPNENYAREIMQLFTIGLFQLNHDGTLKLDSAGNPIPTYDQTGVNNLTKVLTGWKYCSIQASCPNIASGTLNFIDPLILTNTANHDLTAKTLLAYPGSTTTDVPACTGCTGAAISTYAANSMNQALDNIFYHPNVGPFVSRILIQHLVTSDPTPAYVARVATIFDDNGFGVRGDLKAVVKAILLDPEARGDVKTDPNYGKLREPLQFTTNYARAFGVRSADGTSQSDGYFTGRGEFTGMGQVPFMSPTVFNYYSPGYIVPGTSINGPEFAIMTTGTSIQRANFIYRMTYNATPIGVATNSPNGTSFDFSDLQALSTADPSGGSLVDELNKRLLHYTMSPQMKDTILTAVTSINSNDSLGRVRQAIYLVATSSQFQVQR